MLSPSSLLTHSPPPSKSAGTLTPWSTPPIIHPLPSPLNPPEQIKPSISPKDLTFLGESPNYPPIQSLFHGSLFLVKMLYSESSDKLHCLPVHSSFSLLACSLNYSHHYLYLIPFLCQSLLYLVLSSFSLNSKISWPNLLNSLAPLSFIMLTWEHFDPGWILLSIFFMPVLGLLRATSENGTLRKLVALKIHCYELSMLGPHTAQKSCYSSVGSSLSKTFCTKPPGLLPSLPSSFLFNGMSSSFT